MLELKCTPDAQWARSTGFERHTFRKQLTIALSFRCRRHDGASMTEHEDQIAQYRLRLEETAALVARIRHEINNPLTGVLGQAQLLLREDLSERSRKRVQTIEDLALRLRDVVAQLREVQRPGGEADGEQSNS
jgi:signal transduction histidine kinase